MGWLFSPISVLLGGIIRDRSPWRTSRGMWQICVFSIAFNLKTPARPITISFPKAPTRVLAEVPGSFGLRYLTISSLFFLKCMGFLVLLRSLPPCAFYERCVFSCHSSESLHLSKEARDFFAVPGSTNLDPAAL